MADQEFARIDRLPPYIFSIVIEMMTKARRAGEDIIDLGMGNPNLPTPQHIVDKLKEAADDPRNHRYSVSRGIYKLRLAICDWYKRKFDVELDPESEAIVTIGSKEGISHLMLGTIGPGDVVMVPTPTYPIHAYSVVIAGGDLVSIPMVADKSLLEGLKTAFERHWPRPKMLILNFPHNPTTKVETVEFFEEVVAFARENNIIVVHDLAYADLCFDGYKAPSFLQVKGARDVGVEFYTLSKGYSMPGWRLGFCVGNKRLVHALGRIKSYLDYGIFLPIQIAGIIALNGPQEPVLEVCNEYRERRDTLCEGLSRIGWEVEKPKATMFVWAKIPEQFSEMGSLEFSKMLLNDAKVTVSPGIGFGDGGDEHVRFALIENSHRINQAIRGIKQVLISK